jgi:hypothetical protein
VRIFTVKQTAEIANKNIPNKTHDGIIPPRRLTSAREPISSTDISCIAAVARGDTRCALMRSSTQYELATLLT